MSNRILNRIGNFALILFFLLTFTKFLVDLKINFTAATICLTALGCVCLIIGIKIIPRCSVVHIAWLSTILLGLLTALSTRNETIASLLQLITNLGLAIILAKSPPRLSTQLAISIIIIAFFFFKIATNTHPDDVFTVSRNYVSVIVVLVASLYYIACEHEKTKPSILIGMAFMAITMWAIGRAGMASAAIFVAGALFYKVSGRIIAIALVVASVVAFSQISTSITSFGDDDSPLSVFLVGIERIEALGGGGQRDLINAEYLERIWDHPADIFFGAPLEKIQSIAEVDGNPHNSYINLHTIVGILGVCIFFCALLATYTKLFRKQRYLTLIALTACLFRSAFDSTAFHGPLDIIIFYSIFSALMETKFVLTGANVKSHGISKSTHATIAEYSSPSHFYANLNK